MPHVTSHLKQLRLEEQERPTAKGMEYDYRIYDDDKCVYAWHEMSKRNYTEILLKRDATTGGLLRTDSLDNAIAVARYLPEKHYAEQARQAAEYVEKQHPFAGTTMKFHSECLTANEESNNEEVQF